jgi:hypothetical protein
MTRSTLRIGLILLGMLIAALSAPTASLAFPLRFGEDCFYGQGEPEGDGVSTWMGCGVRFDPPYTPYTVDGISVYINQMLLNPDAQRRIHVSVLDAAGIRRQYSEVDWQHLSGRQGWVLIDLADRTYDGPFTVIVNSGIGLSGTDAVFRLGVDNSEPNPYSFVYTSPDSPPPPPSGPFTDQQLARQGTMNMQKLVPVATGLPGFPGGNWMIRAQAPGLQMETTKISITMADVEALHPLPLPALETSPASRAWRLPPIDGLGPRGMVHCPTSLAGITFYDYQDSRERKFLIPHNGPWASRDLVNALASLCRDLAKEGVVGIEHIGIYNNRDIYGTNTRSSHAYGLGIDISGFQFADGREIQVEDHDDPATRAILEHIRDDYLRKYFPTVLDWHYQRHDNHFHVNLPYNP